MIRKSVVVALLFATAAPAVVAQTVDGTWSSTNKHDGLTWIRLEVDDEDWNSTHSMFVAELPTDATDFEIRREPGEFVFEGTRKGDRAAGFFTFTGNPDFNRDLGRLGFETLDRRELYLVATLDAQILEAARLRDLGYGHISADNYLAMYIHGARPDYIEEIASMGYPALSVDDLLSMRIHGVTSEYITEMRDLGFRTSDVDDLVSMRIHGVTPEFIGQMANLGLDTSDIDDLLSMRIHGVTPSFARRIQDLGYPDVTVDELVSMRIHGVTPEYIEQVNERVEYQASVDKIVGMRIHGQ